MISKEAAQQALEAMKLAVLSNGVILSSDPPKDAWKARGVSQKLAQAITDIGTALADDSVQRLTDVQQMIERGTKAWADVPDATGWVEEMRGNVPAPTSQESRQVEPVAYIKGYSKGRCIIEAVDPDWLMPVGMALYRSPPTINEMETVERAHGMGG